jgi:hypothetical protein
VKHGPTNLIRFYSPLHEQDASKGIPNCSTIWFLMKSELKVLYLFKYGSLNIRFNLLNWSSG